MKSILDYNFPNDLKNMSISELNILSKDIRDFLIDNVAKNGGHLASNLGIVELTIALHKVFNSPVDKFIFDVGHQSYIHKILTGRAKDFCTLRQYNGLSGFPKSYESDHDSFDTGHSSTSISAAYGMACARDIIGDKYDVISIIGDGSMTGGEAYEALNNIGESKKKVIIILNDNGMSISQNTGGLSKHLENLRTSNRYINAKTFVKSNLKKSNIGISIFNGMREIKNNIKYSILDDKGVLFEELGFTYLGPVDGHNLYDLIDTFNKAKNLNEPILIHVITRKGKGYQFAEDNPSKFHGIAPFNKETGEIITNTQNKSYSTIAGNYVLDKALNNKNIVAITAAMGDACGLSKFYQILPEKYFDVGIAEQHAVTFSAGLAKSGLVPFVFIYSSFLQRAYDQIIEDVCLQNLPVVFMIDRAGLVGQDGETHNGLFDLSFLNTIPNLTIFTPYNEKSLKDSVDKALELSTPCAIRYPRGECVSYKNCYLHVQNPSVVFLSCGKMNNIAIDTAKLLNEKGIITKVLNISCIKPLVLPKFNDVKMICTFEDNTISGGFGEQIDSKLINTNIKILNFAWPNEFIPHGSTSILFDKYGLEPKKIFNRIIKEYKKI